MQNIGIFAAIGDSITACFGAKGRNGIHSFDEYRGLSFSAGGDANSISLFNFIQKYNPKVQGASFGQHLVELPGTPYHSGDHLNVAQSNARSSDLQGQLNRLYSQLPKGSESLYKLVTLFIGANDLCRNCKMTTSDLVQNYLKNIGGILGQLEAKLPNTLVAVIPIFNVSGVYSRMQGSTYCKIDHALPWECPCILNSDNVTRARMDVAATSIRAGLETLVGQFQAKKNPKFTATFLPFTDGVQVAVLPSNFLSNLDCFHPTVVAHQQLAVAAWNSLLTPTAARPRYWKLNQSPMCPSASNRFHTST